MRFFEKKIVVVFMITLVTLVGGISPCHSQEDKSVNEELIGKELWYKYSNGMAFHVKFEIEGMSYQNLAGSKPETWWGPFPFESFFTKNNEYFISWYEEGYGDYVTLLVDIANNTLYGSALIITKDGPKTHMKPAVIYKKK